MSEPTAPIDVSPDAVLQATQTLRMRAIAAEQGLDKDLERTCTAADRTALGQMRIQTDDKNSELDRQVAQAIAAQATAIAAPQQGTPGAPRTPPKLSQSIAPDEDISDENMSGTEAGSPDLSELR